MATVDQWTAAQNAGQNPYKATGQADAQSYSQSLNASQQDWAKQYINSLNGGNSDPQELNRYLSYQALIPQLNGLNKTYGSGTDLHSAQVDMMNKYAQQIQQGTNNLSQLGDYQGYVKAFGGTAAAPSQQVMQQLSIGALNGDRGAQNYLQQMGLSPLSGGNLWNGLDPKTLEVNSKAYNQYLTDNPNSDMAKTNDTNYWNHFNDIIKNGGAMSADETNSYNSVAAKWGLKNMTDPYNQYISQLQSDKKDALNAQDTALNQTMSTLDAKNFQNMQNSIQTMNNRGLGDSGLAQDAYMRATMAANQDYQKAFADAATNKSDMATKYDTSIGNMQVDQLKNQQAQAQQQVANQQAAVKEQNAQDQFLTSQTGYVYIGGKPVISNGQPITTLDWQKMSETTRHDIASEQLTQQQNTNTYNLGVMQNNTANAKIQADLSMKSQQLQLDWANYGLNSSKAQASIDNMIASAKTAAQNADTGAFKAQAGAVASEMQTLKDQMNAYVSKGQAIPATLQTQFNDTLGRYQSLVSSMGN